ncbi:hypothetical protein [Pseudoduganella albidiflava]|uniref:Uncharacterized protein n=1 Tax=Pseudoduganella albidiflava TaxID=321983 RepID=A0A411WVD0_9BURK|nr:hypothetical protein [Pseudoduganella albidiflava]QBI00710.1 hypothetical protein EYF70_07475 [Pseudoduganella albidiflava]GGY31202.1 hypothetical protein GCM10007387_11510 [Pseudoduganella albidiflava]
MTKPIPKYNAGETFVVEGIITELQVALGRENLLARISPHYEAGSVATGLGTALGGFHGQVAAAASVAMYDGEDTEHFACLIDQQVMCGTFGGASKLPVGKKVRAVVSKHDDVLVARGILSEDTGLVWVSHAWGSKAEQKANWKIALWCFCFAMLCLGVCTFVLGIDTGMSPSETLGWGAVVAGVLCVGVALSMGGTMNALADPATDIFRKLGFADPEHVNLNRYQYGIVHIHELVQNPQSRANHGNVHCYKKAIEDGKLKLTH